MVTKVQSRSTLHSRSPQAQKEQLKIGLVLECAPEGPDQQVCEHLLETLLENVEIQSVTLVNKPNLLTRCGDAVARLLDEGYNTVLIVWDLYPPWGGEVCRHEDREAIFKSLDEGGVNSENVHLVCIQDELEAWLLADHRAVSAAISRLIGRAANVKKIKDFEKKPKTKLMNIFRQHTKRPYQGHKDALLIVKELTDLKRIGKCKSFARFASKATGSI